MDEIDGGMRSAFFYVKALSRQFIGGLHAKVSPNGLSRYQVMSEYRSV